MCVLRDGRGSGHRSWAREQTLVGLSSTAHNFACTAFCLIHEPITEGRRDLAGTISPPAAQGTSGRHRVTEHPLAGCVGNLSDTRRMKSDITSKVVTT
jgi:hypothetical protein